MKILIVGSTSAIVKALVPRFERLGEVKLAGRKAADIKFDLTQWRELPKIEESFDVVVHAAADFGGAKDEDYIRAELVNAVGSLSVCRLAHHVKAKHLVLLSSVSATYREGDPYFGIYALTKRHSEEATRLFCSERKMALTILRPTQVYDDAGVCRRHQEFLYLIADRAQAGQDINLYGSNNALRNYIHLEDLAEICCRVAQGRHTGTFACAHPQSVRIGELAEAAFSVFGRGGRWQFIPDKPDLADLPAIDDYLLYSQIDYWPSIDINDGFKRIRNYRESNT